MSGRAYKAKRQSQRRVARAVNANLDAGHQPFDAVVMALKADGVPHQSAEVIAYRLVMEAAKLKAAREQVAAEVEASRRLTGSGMP